MVPRPIAASSAGVACSESSDESHKVPVEDISLAIGGENIADLTTSEALSRATFVIDERR